MVTDPLFFKLFEADPATFFSMMGLSPTAAAAKAKAYRFHAIEVKETSHRMDGVFIPNDPRGVLHFVEVLFYKDRRAYVDILAKTFAFLKLKKNNPNQPAKAVVVFEKRSLAPKRIGIYKKMIALGFLELYFLDELPETADAPLGISILRLIVKSRQEAPAAARELIERATTEIGDEAARVNLVQLIETAVIYKLPTLTREEVQEMLGIRDVRQLRIYQDAMKEGAEEADREHLKEKLRMARKLAALDLPVAKIASILSLDIARVRKHIAKKKPS